VDDEERLRRMMRITLQAAGYTVSEATQSVRRVEARAASLVPPQRPDQPALWAISDLMVAAVGRARTRVQLL
jgi:DNA-binding response OmpR family regulator